MILNLIFWSLLFNIVVLYKSFRLNDFFRRWLGKSIAAFITKIILIGM